MSKQLKDLSILKPHITESGIVNYLSLKQELHLQELLTEMRDTDVSSFNDKERLAFWLNAYNLITVDAVLKQLEKNPHWKGNISLWSKFKFFYLSKHKIAGKRISLYHLENKILRKEFQDPRIHFAINCASKSCPILPSSLFSPDNLHEYLEYLTTEFINSREVHIDDESQVITLNEIFKWYKNDFQPSILNFISKYSPIKSFENYRIKYRKYNWELNGTFS